ncbi:hypothetical protein D3C76_01500 [compost metagenome]
MFIYPTILNIIYQYDVEVNKNMNVFDNGWVHAVGVLCVLYVIFGSDRKVKITSIIVVFLIAMIELEVTTNFFTKLFGG